MAITVDNFTERMGQVAVADGPDPLDALFGFLIDDLAALPMATAQAYCDRWRGRLEAFELRALASKVSDDGDTRKAAAAASAGGRRSKRAAQRQAARAAAAKKNPDLTNKMDSGSLSSEQMDHIAKAAKQNERAATDKRLIDAITDAPVDQGGAIVDSWLAANADQDKAEERHQTQRRQRSVQRWHDRERDLAAVTIKGDDATIDEFWNSLTAGANKLYESDGGRGVSLLKHPRTNDQRRFDALMHAVAGDQSTPRSSGASRPAVVLNIDWSKVSTGLGCAELMGSGPVPDSVMLELLERADLFINVHDLEGQTLWWGRKKRRATLDQFIRLVTRDRGCVLCGAHWRGAEAHHLLPFNAPGKGRTDIEELALVCPGCHHHVHDNDLTLKRNRATGLWRTRPATPNEIAPRRTPRRSGSTVSKSQQTQFEAAPAAPRSHRSTRTGKTSTSGADDDHDSGGCQPL